MHEGNKDEETKNTVVVSVYFSDKNNQIGIDQIDQQAKKYTHLAGYFAEHDISVNAIDFIQKFNIITESSDLSELVKKESYKFTFDGCGVQYGIAGAIFGYGLQQQCREVERKIRHLIFQGKKVVLNVYGQGLGGVAGLRLAKMIGKIPQEWLTVNLGLLDPTPGNSIMATKLDILECNLANQVMDLRDSKNLKKVLCIYSVEKEALKIFHAPLFPDYPKTCDVQEEIVYKDYTETGVPFFRIKYFLEQQGTVFNFNFSEKINTLDSLKKAYENTLNKTWDFQKHHILSNRDLTIIARSKNQQGMIYPNKYYKHFVEDLPLNDNNITENNCRLLVQPGFFHDLKKWHTEHPLIKNIFKWLLVGIVAVTVLYFTGGLVIIPAIILKTVGIYVLPLLIPLLSVSIALVWYGFITPLRDSLIERSPLATKKETLWKKCVHFFRRSGIYHLRKSDSKPYLDGLEITDVINPFCYLVERLEPRYKMARIYRTSFLTGIRDAFHILMGDHYDLNSTGTGRKGVLDLLIFPVIARRLMGFAFNPKHNVISRAIAFLPAVLLELARGIVGLALTLGVIPLVGLVRLFTLRESLRLKRKALSLQVLTYNTENGDAVPTSLKSIKNLINNLDNIKEIKALKENINYDNAIEEDSYESAGEGEENDDREEKIQQEINNVNLFSVKVREKLYKFYDNDNKAVFFKIVKDKGKPQKEAREAFKRLNVGARRVYSAPM